MAAIAADIAELEREWRLVQYQFAELRRQLWREHGYDVLDLKSHYNPAQPRAPRGQPDGGQWADAGGGGAHDGARLFHTQVEEDNNGRGGIFIDPDPNVRRDLYELDRQDLRRLEPQNRQLPSITAGRYYVPDMETARGMRAELDAARDRVAQSVMEHGFEQHGSEFNVVSRWDYMAIARRTLADPNSRVEELSRGRVAFYNRRTNTLVIANRNNPEQSTMFRPTQGERIIDDLRRR